MNPTAFKSEFAGNLTVSVSNSSFIKSQEADSFLQISKDLKLKDFMVTFPMTATKHFNYKTSLFIKIYLKKKSYP